MIKKIGWENSTIFTGRNGTMKCNGVELLGLGESKGETDKVMISPLTSKGAVGNCGIVVPVEAVPQMISLLAQFTGAPPAVTELTAVFPVPDGFQVEGIERVEQNRTAAEFFGGAGTVFKLTSPDNARKAEIVAEGEVRVWLDGEFFKNKRASAELADRNFYNQDLTRLNLEDAFENCNWFNIYLSDAAHQEVSTESVCSTLEEAFETAVSLLQAAQDEWTENFLN